MLFYFFQINDSIPVKNDITNIVNLITEKLIANLDKITPVSNPDPWQQATFTFAVVLCLLIIFYLGFRLNQKEKYIAEMNAKAFGLAETIANFRHNLETKAKFEQDVVRTAIHVESIISEVKESNEALSSVKIELSRLTTMIENTLNDKKHV